MVDPNAAVEPDANAELEAMVEGEDPTAIAGWEEVGVYSTDEEAQVVVAYLAGQEIEAHAESSVSHEFPVATGSLGMVRVRVPSELLAAALDALARRGEVTLAEGAESPVAEASGGDEPAP